jgi:hypothetical protein
MTRFSSKWILSHSTWYKSRRSRQLWAGFGGGLFKLASHDSEEFGAFCFGPVVGVIGILQQPSTRGFDYAVHFASSNRFYLEEETMGSTYPIAASTGIGNLMLRKYL